MGFRVYQDALLGTAWKGYHPFNLCCRLIRLWIFTFKGSSGRSFLLHRVTLLPLSVHWSPEKGIHSYLPFRTIRQHEEAAFLSPTPGGEGKAIISKMVLKIHGEYGKNGYPQGVSNPYKSTFLRPQASPHVIPISQSLVSLRVFIIA